MSLQQETQAVYSQPMGAYCSRCGTQNSSDAQFCIQCGGDLAPVPSPQPLPVASIHYGGFWIRFLAAFIDGIIVEAVVLPISFVVGFVVGLAGAAAQMPTSGIQIAGGLLAMPVGIIAGWLYFAKMESSPRQATLGKMIFSLKVTDMAGGRISFGRASGRHFAKFLSFITLCVGYIIAGFTEKKQALHDFIVETVVRLP